MSSWVHLLAVVVPEKYKCPLWKMRAAVLKASRKLQLCRNVSLFFLRRRKGIFSKVAPCSLEHNSLNRGIVLRVVERGWRPPLQPLLRYRPSVASQKHGLLNSFVGCMPNLEQFGTCELREPLRIIIYTLPYLPSWPLKPT